MCVTSKHIFKARNEETRISSISDFNIRYTTKIKMTYLDHGKREFRDNGS